MVSTRFTYSTLFSYYVPCQPLAENLVKDGQHKRLEKNKNMKVSGIGVQLSIAAWQTSKSFREKLAPEEARNYRQRCAALVRKAYRSGVPTWYHHYESTEI